MAATATVVAQLNSSSAGAQTGATASFTPSANSKLVVVAIALNNNHTTSKVWSISGGSLSWVDGDLAGPFESLVGANFDVEIDVEWAQVGASPSSMTVTVDAYSGTSTAWYGVAVYEVVGSEPGVFGNLQAVDFHNPGNATPTLALATGKTANSVLLSTIFGISDGGVPAWAADPSGWTVATKPTGTDAVNVAALTSTTDSDAALSGYGTTSNAAEMFGVLIEIGEDTASIEQEGARFGDDDANEAGHGWPVAQDTNLTAALGAKLLRILLNATDDPAALGFVLRYQKNGAGGYKPVQVGATTSPSLGTPVQGTVGVSASGGTSVAPTYPAGVLDTDAVVLVVGQKPATANGGTVTTPSGFTLQGSGLAAGGYGATLGADTGNTNVFVYSKDSVAGTETGTLTVTVGDNGVCWAYLIRIPAGALATFSYAFGSGSDTSAGNVSIATGSMSIAAGDRIIAGMCIPTDVTTPAQFSAESLTQTGTTFGTVTELAEPDSTTGNDIGGFLVGAPVSSGSGSGAVTLAATAGGTTTNVRGPGFVLRIRATGVTNEVFVSTSSNITAGGEATTARLTAPSGKSTSDFVTGRRWDDENGSDTIDITVDDYTEVEWSLTTQSPAVATDYFEFRVYNGSTPLNTYTVTPRWTIGSVAASLPPVRRGLGALLTR